MSVNPSELQVVHTAVHTPYTKVTGCVLAWLDTMFQAKHLYNHVIKCKNAVYQILHSRLFLDKRRFYGCFAILVLLFIMHVLNENKKVI